jgi:hypothetical protein
MNKKIKEIEELKRLIAISKNNGGNIDEQFYTLQRPTVRNLQTLTRKKLPQLKGLRILGAVRLSS